MFFGASASFGTTDVTKDLEEIAKAIDVKKTNEKKRDFEEHIAMYNITKAFVQKKNLILYGGLALNMCMPKAKRFYDENELPDYDFFSYDPRTHAIELADTYHKAGFKYVEVRPGIHYETYKVYVEFHGVADITGIPLRLFNRLLEASHVERPLILKNNPALDMNIVPLDFLRLSFHLELSRPDGHIDRWPKVYKRMALFYNTYPLRFKECSLLTPDPQPRAQELAHLALQYFKESGLPILGLAALKVYLKANGTAFPKNGIMEESMPLVEAFSTDYEADAEALRGHLEAAGGAEVAMVHHAALNKSEVLPPHYILSMGERPIATVYSAQACYSYKAHEGINILSIDSILSMWYASLFALRPYLNPDRLRCAINVLLNIQLKHLQSKKYIWRRFDLQCYGHQPRVEDIKRKRWRSKGFTYRPS